MDPILQQKLEAWEKHLEEVRETEEVYFNLEASEKHLLAKLSDAQSGASEASKQRAALATQEWLDFNLGRLQSKSRYLSATRRLDLLKKAFDAQYLQYKNEGEVIKRNR